MYNSTLYGFVIWCIGCVIPTPLDQAKATTNYSPVFVTNQVTPAFGKATEIIGSEISFSLAATDPNHDDILTVHLFEPDPTTPGAFIFTQFQGTLSIPPTPDQDDPNLRLGTVPANLCLNARSGDTFDVYAVVADRPFNTMGNLTQASGGLTDSNHWELTCM